MFPFEWIDTETIDKWYIQESVLYSQRSYSLAVEWDDTVYKCLPLKSSDAMF